MHFLLTGHTGFKGTWMALLLLEMGHKVSGISLEPEKRSLFNQVFLQQKLEHDFRIDVRDRNLVSESVKEISPEIVVHLAAQSLVRRGYREPILTYETNVMGTLNVLVACSEAPSVKTELIVTTDKVYKNHGGKKFFRENDSLGGDDPYSASKAMADIMTQSFMSNNLIPTVAIARAGNVIGGGDISEDRLVPDLVEAFSREAIPELRFPNAVRPWQHVLDCVNGYIELVNHMVKEEKGGIWNFGPDTRDLVTVSGFVETMAMAWGASTQWKSSENVDLRESSFLALDSHKAEEVLKWKNTYSAQEAISLTADWYKCVRDGVSPEKITRQQIQNFLIEVSK